MTQPRAPQQRFGLPDPRNPLADELEQVAHSVPDIGRPYDELRTLLHRLPPGHAPDVHSARAGQAVPKDVTQLGVGGTNSALQGPPPGFESGSLIGILPELFYGKENLLVDPMLDGLEVLAPFPLVAAPGAAAEWQGSYILNSGTAPATRSVTSILVTNPDNGLNSFAALFTIGAFGAAGDVSLLYRSKQGITPATAFAYLIGAWRLQIVEANNFTNISSVTITVELVDGAGTVLAASSPLDWKAFYATGPVQRSKRLAAPKVSPAAVVTYLQLRFRIVCSGAGAGSVIIRAGEPQLTYSASELPPPYSPLVGQYLPYEIKRIGSGVRQISGWTETGAFPVYEQMSNGEFRWGPGTAAADIRLYRSAAGNIIVDANGQANSTSLQLEATSGQLAALSIHVAGDSNDRLMARGDATLAGLELGPGNAARDVRFYRAAAGNPILDSNGQAVGTSFDIQSTAGQRNHVGLYVGGDTTHRAWLEGSATITGLHFGPGNAALDLRLYRSGAKVATLDDVAAGAVTFNLVGGPFQISGTQILTTRRTGWTAPTGTAQRGTFATDTVTLINLARAVKALIDDVTTHGIIGT